jgi:hypothetical protein
MRGIRITRGVFKLLSQDNPFATLSMSMSSNILQPCNLFQRLISHLLVLVCLPNCNAERSTFDMLVVVSLELLYGGSPNPTAMKVQYLKAKNFVNGLNGMLLRGPSG